MEEIHQFVHETCDAWLEHRDDRQQTAVLMSGDFNMQPHELNYSYLRKLFGWSNMRDLMFDFAVNNKLLSVRPNTLPDQTQLLQQYSQLKVFKTYDSSKNNLALWSEPHGEHLDFVFAIDKLDDEKRFASLQAHDVQILNPKPDPSDHSGVLIELK